MANAIRHVLRAGCSWRSLPHDFPCRRTVHGYFHRWRQEGLRECIHEALRPRVRQHAGRKAALGTDILDSRSVQTTEVAGPRGCDAGKKGQGRKCHIVVDTLGLLLAVVVHTADIQDRDGARLVLARLAGRCPRLRLIWTDDGYWGPKLGAWLCRQAPDRALDIVSRLTQASGFLVLPRRRVVERTFAWLGRYRCPSKGYEGLPETSRFGSGSP